MEPFQEQAPLQMATPNTTNEKQIKWIPLISSSQEAHKKSTIAPSKSIDESIKNQIQKKMQTLLKPMNDDDER